MTLHPDDHDPIAERLDAWADEYRGRRTVPGQMLDDARDLVRAAASYHARRARAELAAQAHAHDTTVDRLERQADHLRDLLTAARKVQTEQQALVAEKTRLREEREQHDHEVQVTIGRTLGGWRVADLEEVAYRLRAGGAVDDTPVEMSTHTAKAKVPAPNLVPLVRLAPDTRAERLADTRPTPPAAPAPHPTWQQRATTTLGSPAGLFVTALLGWGAIASVLEAATRW